MNKSIISTLFALGCRQRLLLALGVVLVLAVALFNSLTGSVDINGWISGFTHPLHGGDHFLTMLAVGIWAAQLRGKAIWLLPLTFVGVMSLGGLAGAAGLFIPSAELIILLSGLVFSVFIVRKIRFSSQTNVIIVAFFAFFHGFAHGQEISTSASLISYTLGFMVATLLLHGAGILIVRLLVVIFALFISQLAYAQSSIINLTVNKTTIATTQIDKTHEFFMTTYSALPDRSHGHDRQLLYSGEDGGGGHAATIRQHRAGWIETIADLQGSLSETHDSQSAMRWGSLDALQVAQSGDPTSYDIDGIQNSGFPSLCVIHHTSCSIAAKWLSADWLDNQRLGIDFLTGVGKTSPPVVSLTDSTPRFCSTVTHSATLGKPISETILRFDLHTLHTLATSFLTNGVGATSPPVWRVFPIDATHNFNELVLHNSIRCNRSTALQSPVSSPLFSCNSVVSKTQHNSVRRRLSFLLTDSMGHFSFTKLQTT